MNSLKKVSIRREKAKKITKNEKMSAKFIREFKTIKNWQDWGC